MTPQSILRDLCDRYGVAPERARRLLPLVERALKAPPSVRERLLDLVADSLEREAAHPGALGPLTPPSGSTSDDGSAQGDEEPEATPLAGPLGAELGGDITGAIAREAENLGPQGEGADARKSDERMLQLVAKIIHRWSPPDWLLRWTRDDEPGQRRSTG